MRRMFRVKKMLKMIMLSIGESDIRLFVLSCYVDYVVYQNILTNAFKYTN